MTDPINVCNQALGVELGHTMIQSFADGTTASRLCNELYADTRDAVLELHPWNFAAAQASLAHHPDTPIMTWRHMYALAQTPSYCIKVRGTEQSPGDKFEVASHEQYGRVLYSNRSTVSITYTKRVENLNDWSPLAIQVLIKLIASKLAKPLTGQNSTTQLKWQEALALLPQAQGSDGREGTPHVLRPNTHLVWARHGNGSTPWVEGPEWSPF